jgi:hypothetical protein
MPPRPFCSWAAILTTTKNAKPVSRRRLLQAGVGLAAAVAFPRHQALSQPKNAAAPVNPYRHIRGFNYQPSWSPVGLSSGGSSSPNSFIGNWARERNISPASIPSVSGFPSMPMLARMRRGRRLSPQISRPRCR